jgi:cytochrome P450
MLRRTDYCVSLYHRGMEIPQELRGLPRTRRPALLNAAQHWFRIGRFTDELATLGDRFVVPMPGTGAWLGLTHPADIEKVFRAPGSAVHFGEALRMASPHELVLGPSALTSLDGEIHHTQRRMLMPVFRSDALRRYEPAIEAKARSLARTWPVDRPTAALPYTQRVTLEIIMTVIFGVTDQGRADRLRTAVLDLMDEGGTRRFQVQIAIAQARKTHYERPFPRMERLKAAIDAIVREEIADRRQARDSHDRDMLGYLLAYRDEAGRPMSESQICDQLRLMLIGGHDTTASTIAWVIERVAHTPSVLNEVERTVRDGDDSYLDAVIMETLRLRPVFPFTVRLTKQPLHLDGLTVPPETFVVPYITLVHRRPDIYPDPLAFRPERFVDTRPGAYSWIPFGGGIRRCIGAPMATLEARIVLRTLFQELDIRATRPGSEAIKRRAVVVVPAHGARTTASRLRGPVTAEGAATCPYHSRPEENA